MSRDDEYRWRGGREVWRERNRDAEQYSRYGRDEEREGRFGPDDGGGYGYGRSDYGRGFGQGRGLRDYGREEWGGEDWRAEERGRQVRRDFGREYARDRARRAHEDRGFLEKAGDEVASWFGDEDAERRRRQDEVRSHRGRGPRGYTRADDRIREDVNDRLTDDRYVDATDIEVAVSAGEVTLNGHVPHRSMKRRAEDVAESVSGVTQVQNNLRAGQGTGTSGGASAMAGMGGGAGYNKASTR